LFALLAIDKSGRRYYIQSMTATAQLLREIETMPEATAAEVLDFAMFLKGRQIFSKQVGTVNLTVPMTKDAYGLFRDLKGMDTTIERDEEDRI
jgi:hypothetical protein